MIIDACWPVQMIIGIHNSALAAGVGTTQLSIRLSIEKLDQHWIVCRCLRLILHLIEITTVHFIDKAIS